MNNNFDLSEDSKIYIICPANNKTGGTELLHQLAFQLNTIGKHAYITYYMEGKSDIDNPTPEEFKKYVSNFYMIDDIQDLRENVIVFPEVCIGKHKKFRKAQKCVWWLSVDNYNAMLGKLNRLKKYGMLSFLKHIWLNDYGSQKDIKKIAMHLYQSYFAADFLKKMGVPQSHMSYLSDYINDIYITDLDKSIKEDIVIYNPKKGFEFTQKLIEATCDIKWIPIQNMTNLEVQDLMKRAKVYIDFGNHPGKDRIPREAAMSGCCVITNKKGSAAYSQDVPIPDECKFDDCIDMLPQIIEKIKQCLDAYDEQVLEFSSYRKFIMCEKAKFREDVINIFR